MLPSTINGKKNDTVLEFIQTTCYSGMVDESVTKKGVRIYKQLKIKISILQAIKQIHYQSYYWLQSDMAMISETDLSENGWVIVGGNIQPVWFEDKGLSPNLFSNIKQI